MDFNIEALKEAEKSKCKKRKVGALIVDPMTQEIKARGHNYINVANSTVESCEDDKGNTRPEVIHAEISAINSLGSLYNTKGNFIYVTHQPCDNCQKAIDKAGLQVILVEHFMKFDNGKLQYSLVPVEATKALAEVLTYGAKKYKPNNWKQVDDTDRYVDALYRHLEAWRAGEKLDGESGLPHLAHAITNISFLLYFEQRK